MTCSVIFGFWKTNPACSWLIHHPRSNDLCMSSKMRKIFLALRYVDNFIINLSTSISANSKLISEAMAPCNFNIGNRTTITQMIASKLSLTYLWVSYIFLSNVVSPTPDSVPYTSIVGTQEDFVSNFLIYISSCRGLKKEIS